MSRCWQYSLGVHDGIRHVAYCFHQNIAQVASRTVICRGKEIHAVLAGLEPIALAETSAGFIIRVVHSYAQPTLLTHDGKAGNICGPIADVYHVLEGNGT